MDEQRNRGGMYYERWVHGVGKMESALSGSEKVRFIELEVKTDK